MTRVFLSVLFGTLALIVVADLEGPPLTPASTSLLYPRPITYLVPHPTPYITYLPLLTNHIHIQGGPYTVTCPPTSATSKKDCRSRADGCIVCLCDTSSAGFCKVRGGNCTLNYFKEDQLTPYEYDIDIQLLRDDNRYTGNICDPATEQTYQGVEEDQIEPPSNFSDTKYPYQTNRPQLTCSNADAINLLDNTLIGIDDDIEEFINFEKCDTNVTQCHHQEPVNKEPEPCSDCDLGSGEIENVEKSASFSRRKRATGAFALQYLTAASGLSTLRSVPMLGGCPSTNMCIRNGRCCALVIFGKNGMISCPRRC